MARDTDEQQRVIREDRMRRGKEARTASARREKRAEDPYVPKTRRRRDPMIHGEGSQAHVDDSSQVVDPTPAHDYAGYADEGFAGYDRMKEERMFYQPSQDEAEDEGCQRMRGCLFLRMLWRIILRQIILFLRVSLRRRLSHDIVVFS